MALVCLSVLIPVISGEMKVVDLTWAHSASTIYWPGNPAFNFSIMSREKLTNYWYESNWFSTPEHGGTHLDAPAHFSKDSWRTQEIPAERLIGPAVILDVTSQAKADPDYRVTQADFEAYESKHGRIPHGAIVIMNSGWGSRYPNKTRVFNSDQPGTPSTFHFPGYHEDAITWLVANRNASIVGVDTPSNDHGQSTDFKVHVILGENNIPGLENVARLDQIPEKGATIFVGSIKLFDGSGGPARILATFDQDAKPCDCVSSSSSIATFVGTSVLSVLLVSCIV
ncbi:isatin hydrolase-like [Haliotis cracherodii]|uniref:isatin hydrolase-like n=1 Tax=Haliotis cracherodii TaxID=6455 RepID=UPI0039EA13F1